MIRNVKDTFLLLLDFYYFKKTVLISGNICDTNVSKLFSHA